MAEKEQHVSITFRTPASKRDLLDEIARNMKRDRSYVVNEAVEEYLAAYCRVEAALAEGMAAYERGEVIDHDKLFENLEQELAGHMDRAS